MAGRENVGIHPQAHAAASLAPFEAGRFEDRVESFLFGLAFHLAAARHDHRVDLVRDMIATHHGGRGTIFHAAVGARTDKDPIERQFGQRGAGLDPHVGQSLAVDLRSFSSANLAGSGTRVDRSDLPWIGPPGDLRRDIGRGKHERFVESAPASVGNCRQRATAASKSAGAYRRPRR